MSLLHQNATHSIVFQTTCKDSKFSSFATFYFSDWIVELSFYSRRIWVGIHTFLKSIDILFEYFLLFPRHILCFYLLHTCYIFIDLIVMDYELILRKLHNICLKRFRFWNLHRYMFGFQIKKVTTEKYNENNITYIYWCKKMRERERERERERNGTKYPEDKTVRGQHWTYFCLFAVAMFV